MEILAKLVVSGSSLGLAGCETDTESFAKLFGFAGCGRNQSRVSAFAAKPSRDRPLDFRLQCMLDQRSRHNLPPLIPRGHFPAKSRLPSKDSHVVRSALISNFNFKFTMYRGNSKIATYQFLCEMVQSSFPPYLFRARRWTTERRR